MIELLGANIIYRQSPIFFITSLKQLFSHLMETWQLLSLLDTLSAILVTAFTKTDKFDQGSPNSQAYCAKWQSLRDVLHAEWIWA